LLRNNLTILQMARIGKFDVMSNGKPTYQCLTRSLLPEMFWCPRFINTRNSYVAFTLYLQKNVDGNVWRI